MVVCTNRKPLTLTRKPTSLVLPSPPYKSTINGTNEAPEGLPIPDYEHPYKNASPNEGLHWRTSLDQPHSFFLIGKKKFY